MKRKITRFQALCFIILWVVLCFFVITSAERIDGPVILSLIISAALVFIPVYKSIRGRKN